MSQGSPLRQDPADPIAVVDLATVPYREAWDLQRRLITERAEGRRHDTILLLEHPPVFTLGRRAGAGNVLLDEDERTAAGIDLVEVDRGGDVTYHGPGQLVAYPILRLARTRDVVEYVRALESAAIRAVAGLGVRAGRRDGLTGVWVGREKLVAIGVRVSAGGVTSHGLALNVDPDLSHFGGIVPCGLASEGVCSLATLGATTDMATVRRALAEALVAELGGTPGPVRAELPEEVPA